MNVHFDPLVDLKVAIPFIQKLSIRCSEVVIMDPCTT